MIAMTSKKTDSLPRQSTIHADPKIRLLRRDAESNTRLTTTKSGLNRYNRGDTIAARVFRRC